MASISSKKLGDAQEGKLSNPYKYQGTFSEFDYDIGWNDFALREYDPQIGRFTTQDPYSQFASPYVGMGSSPVNNIDPSGGWIDGVVLGATQSVTVVGSLSKVGAKAAAALKVGQVLHIASSVANALNNFLAAAAGESSANRSPASQPSGQSSQPSPIVPNSPPPGGGIPIFWEEEGFPDIERIDLVYYNIAPACQKVQSPLPGLVFLKFRYIGPNKSGPNRAASEKAYKDRGGSPNPSTDNFQMHEVPYASTKEGGGVGVRGLAFKSQNWGHGVALGAFYIRNHMKAGDYFLVPLVKLDGKKVPVPEYQPYSNPSPSPTPVMPPIAVPIGEGAEVLEEEELALELLEILIIL